MRASPVVHVERRSGLKVEVRHYSDGRYGFDFYPPGEDRRQLRVRDLAIAVQKAKELIGITNAGKLDAMSIDREEFVEFLRWKDSRRAPVLIPRLVASFLIGKATKGRSEAHIAELTSTLRPFAEHFRGSIGDLTREAVERWLDKRGVGDRRWNNMLAAVVALHRFSRRDGAIGSEITPVEQIERKRVVIHVETYTVEDLEKLLTAVPATWLPAVVFGAFAGIRPEEICPAMDAAKPGLRWENVMWAKNKIDVPAEVSKVRRRRFVPLLEPTRAFLGDWRYAKGPVVPRQKMSNMTARWARAAGVGWKNDGLRHSYASYRLAVINDIQALSLELGNSPKMIHDHYLDLKHEDEAAAWFAVRPSAVKE